MSPGLYIHIPYCLSKCYYCNFVSSPLQSKQALDTYLKNVKQEIKLRLTGEVDTIYIGGGTPSLCSARQLLELMQTISKQTSISSDAEISVEINPGTIDKIKMNDYKNIGINRLSIGVQSLDNNYLKNLGRIHTVAEAEQVVKLAEKTGFENVSCDLISGLPGQKVLEFKEELKTLIAWQPKHISLYGLSIEKNTPLYQQIQRSQLSWPDEDDGADMIENAQEWLEQAGYEQYELSNYSRPGFQCLHNLKYWTNQEYLGIGLAAHSYLGGQRQWNCKDINDYNQLLKNGQIAVAGQEKLEYPKNIAEFIIIGLRLTTGINLELLINQFGSDWHLPFQTAIKKSISQGLLEKNHQSMRLTKRGMMLANVVFREFL